MEPGNIVRSKCTETTNGISVQSDVYGIVREYKYGFSVHVWDEGRNKVKKTVVPHDDANKAWELVDKLPESHELNQDGVPLRKIPPLKGKNLTNRYFDYKNRHQHEFLTWIAQLENTLKYTKKTVKRNQLLKEIAFWKIEMIPDKDESNEQFRKFNNRYPLWRLKA